MIDFCRDNLGASEFFYSTRQENTASRRLAEAMNFTLCAAVEKTDNRNGQRYTLLRYKLNLLSDNDDN